MLRQGLEETGYWLKANFTDTGVSLRLAEVSPQPA